MSLSSSQLEVSIPFSTPKQIPRDFASSSKFCWCQGSYKALLTKAHTQPNRKSNGIRALSVWSITENEPSGFFNSKDQRSLNAKLRNYLLSVDGFFFFFPVESGCHYVAQLGFELPGISDPPALASLVTGTIGTCHHA